MQSTQPRPAPNTEHSLYQPYFQGLKEHCLCVQECAGCGRRQWPPRDLCSDCRGSEFGWAEIGKTGQVYTFSVVHRAPHPWFRQHTPYAIVVVELKGGVRMLGNCFGDDVRRVACGLTMSAQFQREESNGITLLQWVPASSESED